jgi:hypothetical protein
MQPPTGGMRFLKVMEINDKCIDLSEMSSASNVPPRCRLRDEAATRRGAATRQ